MYLSALFLFACNNIVWWNNLAKCRCLSCLLTFKTFIDDNQCWWQPCSTCLFKLATWTNWENKHLRALKCKMILMILMLQVDFIMRYWQLWFVQAFTNPLAFRRGGTSKALIWFLCLSTDWPKTLRLPSLLQRTWTLCLLRLSLCDSTPSEFLELSFPCYPTTPTPTPPPPSLSLHMLSFFSFFFLIPCTSQVWHGLCFSP